MDSRNRIFFVILALLIISTGLLYYFIYSPRHEMELTPALVKTDNTIWIWQEEKIPARLTLLFTSDFKNILQKHPLLKNTINSYWFIDSLLKQNKNIYKLVSEQPISLSLHRVAASRFEFLFVIPVDNRLKDKDLLSFFPELKNYHPDKRQFESSDIVDIKNSSNKTLFTYSVVKNLLAISKSSLLVEDFIRNVNSMKSNLSENKYSQNHKMYVNQALIREILQYFFPDATLGELNPAFCNEGYYQFDPKDDIIIWRGNSYLPDTIEGYLRLWKRQSAEKSDIFSVVSSSAALMTVYQVSDMLSWYQDKLNLPESEAFMQQLSHFENQYGVSLQNQILPLIYHHLALVYFDPFGKDLNRNKAIFVKSSSIDRAQLIFEDISGQTENNNTLLQQGIKITRLGKIFYFLFGKGWDLDSVAYFTPVKDYLVFSENPNLLSKLKNDYENFHTLGTSMEFNRFYENFSSDMNSFTLVRFNRILSLLREIIYPEEEENFYQAQEFFRQLGTLGIQSSFNKNSFYEEIIWETRSVPFSKLEYLAEINLDTIASAGPWVVKNHKTGNNEIVFFDANYKMYLADINGSLLWTRSLEEPVAGDLFQIDVYNNNKLQYAFCTGQKLHVIDRLGRNVGNYPIRLSAPTHTGLSVFNLRQNNSDKLLVGCDNQNVFGYTKSGKPLNGWRPASIQGNLSMPVQYFIKNGKVYFLGATDKGYFYLWTENGKQVINPISLETVFHNPFRIQFQPEFTRTHLISVDTSGKTYFIYLNGKVEILPVKISSRNIFFDYLNIDNERDKELIYAFENNLLVYSHEGKPELSASLPYPVESRPVYFYTRNTYYMAYLSNNNLIICDFNGDLANGFPIPCELNFVIADIDHDSRFEVMGFDKQTFFITRF